MYKLLSVLIVTGVLAGCSTTPPLVPPVTVRTEIVKVTVPETFLSDPPLVTPLNLKTATQKDVARWITEKDRVIDFYATNIEGIKQFNDASK